MYDAQQLTKYADQNGVRGLTLPSLQALKDGEPGYDIEKARRFLQFQSRIDEELLTHRIIRSNGYCGWFERGEQSFAQVREFIVQFSVFSNLFLVAQLYKTINADTLDGMRASKEILANEIGVIFNPGKKREGASDGSIDPEIVSTEGSVEGGQFRFKAAHFEWLIRIAEKLDLGFEDIGKRRHGTDSTLHFCDELVRLYGSPDYQVSQAASYAVENWAAAGFWDQLVQGLEIYNERTGSKLPLGFFAWHAKIEAQHAAHTQEELEELYFSRTIDENRFIQFGKEMLDGVAVFWDGLDAQRRCLVEKSS